MPLITYGGGILKVGNALAASTNCCCDSPDPCLLLAGGELVDANTYINSTPGSFVVQWNGRSAPTGKYTYTQDGSLVFEFDNGNADIQTVRTGYQLETKDFTAIYQGERTVYGICYLYGSIATHHLLGTADVTQRAYEAGDFDKYATWDWEAAIVANEVQTPIVTFNSGYKYTLGDDGGLSVYSAGQYLTAPTVVITVA